jgi:hypothetical protein
MTEKHTILGKALEAIISIFKEGYKSFMVKLFKKLPDELKEKLIDIVDIVERIKTYVDSPAVDLITFAIPGDADDKAVAWLRSILSSVTTELNLLDKPTSEYSASDLHNIGTLLTKEITGMSYGQSAVTIENAYQNSKIETV